MRLFWLLVPLAVLGISVWMMSASGAFPHIALLLLAAGASASLMLVAVMTVYSADQAAFDEAYFRSQTHSRNGSLRVMVHFAGLPVDEPSQQHRYRLGRRIALR
ncbi:hypothetical protein ELY33_01030 [Vreelandella andesensis]|uniref:Uncharacterized protein n=1 Tax=Vreelandella andesensis TaxID=447567 RepID=A0A433KZ14_9GAMM|nr:hypothetical protein [Halomonas andesensis]RUR34794.1 hypothetical protein ELY33_01030 [Halomonas andesensis]